MWFRRITLLVVLVLLGGLAWALYPMVRDLNRHPTVSVSPAVRDLVAVPSQTPRQPDASRTKPGGGQAGLDEQPAEVVEPTAPEPDGQSIATLTIPPAFSLRDVPFAVQAPTANWDLPFQEACEEASVLMVNRFYTKKTLPGPEELERIIVQMAEWGDDHLYSMDTDVKTTAKYFTEYLAYPSERVSVVYDMTMDDIKAVLASGKPVIVPAAGRDLGNRYFTQPGPLYHMLVIIGYDRDEFITNDPGTKRGEGYRYAQQVLYDAIHDLTSDKENIRQGRKAMIVVSP